MSKEEKEWYEEMIRSHKKGNEKIKTEKKREVEEKALAWKEKYTEQRRQMPETHTQKNGEQNKGMSKGRKQRSKKGGKGTRGTRSNG